MDPKFSVFIIVGRPPSEVFEAVADPGKLSAYFTTGGAKGRLEEGATVTWDFHDFPGAFPVEIDEVVENERIAIRWDANEGGEPAGYQTNVIFTFSPVDGGERTRVEVEEHGWRDSEAGLKASYGNCMGWSQMLFALKAWVEHGINLREGAYK
jgi:uncharacterized protein YndB with AHSA1/START domain